jgi:hypothetical protein
MTLIMRTATTLRADGGRLSGIEHAHAHRIFRNLNAFRTKYPIFSVSHLHIQFKISETQSISDDIKLLTMAHMTYREVLVEEGYALLNEHIESTGRFGSSYVVPDSKRKWYSPFEQTSRVCAFKVAMFNIVDNKPSDLVVITRKTRLCDKVQRVLSDSLKACHDAFPGFYPLLKYLSAFTVYNNMAIDIGDYHETATLDEQGVCEGDWIYIVFNGYDEDKQSNIVRFLAEMIPFQDGVVSKFFNTVEKGLEEIEEEDKEKTEDEGDDDVMSIIKALTPKKRRPGSGDSGGSSNQTDA